MAMTANYITNGVFVSNPFYELGAERTITQIAFNRVVSGGSTLQVKYRTAGSNGVWGSWSALTGTSPIAIGGAAKQYLQYSVALAGATTNNSTLNDVTLTTPGTQLAGDLNGIATFTAAASPYWATSDISFTSGTHTFQAGTTILFLPETGMSVGAASIICNGTVTDSVKFLYFTGATGQWDGIYFNENSDAGVTSTLNYTVIANAGFGVNNSNLTCYLTSEPTLNRCNIRNSSGNGVRLNSSHISIQNSTLKSNTGSGLYLQVSNPVVNNTTISSNGQAGIFMTTSGSLPNFASTVLSNNQYGIYYPTSNLSIPKPLGTLTLTGNTYNGICLPGGNITDNQRWYALPSAFPIIILDNLFVGQYYGKCRLTIEPGNTIKIATGKKIQIGISAPYGGELYAVGAVDSVITFTSINGLSGGWEGLVFNTYSNYSGTSSVMNYCVVEKGNAYNMYVESTNTPAINNCTFRNAVQDGAKFYDAYNSVINSTFQSNGRYPVFLAEPNTYPYIKGNTYTGNTINMIGYSGGSLSATRIFRNDGIPYHVLDNILIGVYNNVNRMTVQPGTILNFASGKGIQVGYHSGWYYGGELYSEGKADSIIQFKPYSGTAGDWSGIYFHDNSDWNGATSSLKYCTITKANDYNVYVENTGSVTIDRCTLSYAISDGLRYQASAGSFTNNTFSNNGRYPVWYKDWQSYPHHRTNTFTANGINMIAMNGGHFQESRTMLKDNAEYLFLNNVTIGIYNGVCRLTIEPGNTINFAPGTGVQVALHSGWYYGGELYAVGKADSLIAFKPQNNTAGGWTGIYFHDHSDWNGSTSHLKYCTITKGGDYNFRLENTGSVTIENSVISYAVTDGLRYTGSGGTLINNTINNNGRYPLYFMDWSSAPVHNNNTFTANGTNYIAMSGGTFSSNYTVLKDNADYYVLDNILIAVYNSKARMTVEPGVNMKFATGKGMQVGYFSGWYYGGELFAEGLSSAMITFSPFSEVAGDWNGIFFADESDWGGSVSSLKYCTVRRGDVYNIKAQNTTQPVIENCRFQQSDSIGLLIVNSNLTIKNSIFAANSDYGIYLGGTGTATLGNGEALTCGLYNNGLYELYNNSTADVNARYNYWGTGDSTMVHSKIFDKGDNPAKGRVWIGTFAQVPPLPTTNTTMTGSLKYTNTVATPMQNAALTIKNWGGTTVASTTANTSGVYTFAAFPSGNYRMNITPTHTWGGVNSTDALAILNHFAQILPLTGMKLAAADVNASHSINGTDAMLVMKRYSLMISSFPAGDQLYHTTSLSVNLTTGAVTNNMDMIWFGDVNASWTPPAKTASQVGLVYEGNLQLGSNTEFELPVRLKTGMEVGAISLGFYYPEQYLEVQDARLANGTTGFSWTAQNGLFVMGWCDMNTLNVNNDEVVVILKMKTKDLSTLGSGIALELYENCEFADGTATPNPGAIVSIPTINAPMTGLTPGALKAALTVYPNPVNQQATVSFSLDRSGKVSIELFDIPGKRVLEVAHSEFGAGDHHVALDASSLAPGVYFLKISGMADGEKLSGMIKVVVSR
jgi:hypothetical protein